VIYVILSLVVALGLSGGYGWYQGEKRELAEAKVTTLEAQIGRQNDAVAATKAEGDRRVAAATKGVAASAAVTQAMLGEAARLRKELESGIPVGTDCPAGAAVAQVRRGLRP